MVTRRCGGPSAPPAFPTGVVGGPGRCLWPGLGGPPLAPGLLTISSSTSRLWMLMGWPCLFRLLYSLSLAFFHLCLNSLDPTFM